MKKCLFLSICFFLISFANAQDETIKKGFISADKLNIVYRGFPNNLTIVVPDCKSFEATALGLTKISDSKYTLTPGPGLEVKIKLVIILNDDSIVNEEHIFKILNTKMLATINGQNCEKCIVQLTKKELENAKISIYSEPDFNFGVGAFSVDFSESDCIEVKGNSISSTAYQKIKALKIGSIFKINRISYDRFYYGCIVTPKPITIMIVDENNNK